MYILVDELENVTIATKAALSLPVLNYQYGYITELKETLAAYDKTAVYAVKKFPLIWVEQPFTITSDKVEYFGVVNNLRAFIINESGKNLKAKERMTGNFKTVIYPIYLEWMKQIRLSPAFKDIPTPHKVTDRYYWGEEQSKILNDIFDCMEISGISLTVHNNVGCQITNNF